MPPAMQNKDGNDNSGGKKMNHSIQQMQLFEWM